jgi:flavin reductase (DIM6/NTAB) family NADH-FMN oxidoreductase RutF
VEPTGEALAYVPLAVVVVAAAAQGVRSCSTGTASYVSYEPALVVTPLSTASRTAQLVSASRELSISVLAAGQADLAVRASRPSDGDKFAEQEIEALEPPEGRGAPGVAGSVATFWCDVESLLETGSTTIVVVRVRAVVAEPGLEPLLRFERRFHALGAVVEVEVEPAYPL